MSQTSRCVVRNLRSRLPTKTAERIGLCPHTERDVVGTKPCGMMASIESCIGSLDRTSRNLVAPAPFFRRRSPVLPAAPWIRPSSQDLANHRIMPSALRAIAWNWPPSNFLPPHPARSERKRGRTMDSKRRIPDCRSFFNLRYVNFANLSWDFHIVLSNFLTNSTSILRTKGRNG